MHLMPAFLGLGAFLLGLALSHPYLCKSVSELEAEWAKDRPVPVPVKDVGLREP